MKVKITKKALHELVDILVDILHSTKSQKIKLDNFLIRLAVFPFYTDETLKRREESLKEIIALLDEESISKFEEFNEKYLEWLRKYYPELEYKMKIILDFEEDNSSFEDGFLDFDSEDIENDINHMHYDEKEKISASEFMQKYGIEEDLIYDIQTYLKEYDNMVLFHLSFDEEYLEELLKILHKFIYLLEISVEFKDLATGLKKFEKNLENIDLSTLDEETKKMLKIFIETVFADIEKWVDEVLIHQTARDIHYLDASLLANIAQIEIIMGEQTK